MDKLSLRSRAAICFFAIVTLLVALIGPARSLIAQTSSGPLDDASLLEGFRHTEVASVSDAIEQLMISLHPSRTSSGCCPIPGRLSLSSALLPMNDSGSARFARKCRHSKTESSSPGPTISPSRNF